MTKARNGVCGGKAGVKCPLKYFVHPGGMLNAQRTTLKDSEHEPHITVSIHCPDAHWPLAPWRDVISKWCWLEAAARSEYENNQLKAETYWLQLDFATSRGRDRNEEEKAKQVLQNTLIALHLVSPGDSAGLAFIKNQEIGQIVSLTRFRPLQTTEWTARVAAGDCTEANVVKLVDGIHEAFRRKVVRLQNAVQLLELGLQADNIHIQIFLWTTGLDALLMAGEAKVFVTRLCEMLGEESLVLPASHSGQPQYRIKEIARDLYDLRSKIAHGLEIPRKFREPIDLLPGRRVPYREVLLESAFFLLSGLLKKIFLDGLIDKVADTKRWRAVLQGTAKS